MKKSLYRVDDAETTREGTIFEALNDADAKKSFTKSLMGIHPDMKNKLVLKRIATRQENGTYKSNYGIVLSGHEVETAQTMFTEEEVKKLIQDAIKKTKSNKWWNKLIRRK